MLSSLASKLLPRSFREECQQIFDKHNHKVHAPRKRVARNCSTATREERASAILLMFATLYQLGFKLQSPAHLREKHVHDLCKHWAAKKLAARTIHTRLSILRVFCSWICKPGLVRAIEIYLPGQDELTHRYTVAQKNLSWKANNVDPLALIGQAKTLDERMACYLSLQHAFGLRVKESIEMRPRKAVDYDWKFLYVTDGTKGGRPRPIEIKTEYQRQVLELAIRIADNNGTGRVRWRDLTWKQAQGRFYRLARRLRITKAGLGVTAHGVRHEYAQDGYRDRTQLPTPIEGGALGTITADTHRRASIDVSRELGHGRISVTAAYYGSYGHKLRGKQDGGAGTIEGKA